MRTSRPSIESTSLASCFATEIGYHWALGRTLKRINPGHALPDDQCVDVVGALVSLHRLQVRHVAEDGILVGDAVGAQDVARQAGALKRHPNVVSLGHRDMLESS